MKEGGRLDDEIRKKVLREDLKKKNGGKSVVTSKYVPLYPDSAEREYIRLTNAYMKIEKEVILKYLPELKRILTERPQSYNMDSKKDNEKKRQEERFSLIDNSVVRLGFLFNAIQKELDASFGLYDLKRELMKIADSDHKLTIKEWKKVIKKTLGIDILDDYYSGDFYREMLEKWVSDNVDLISTVPSQSLGKMKQIVYKQYMDGATTTDIVKEIQRQYGMTKKHARLIARDQTAKLNSAITKHQQQDAGVGKYKWSDSRDERVRKSHHRLNGHIFSWDNPPETDRGRRCHPGEDYQCRCCAIPVFDIDDLDLPV